MDNLLSDLAEFHFLRPEWFLALIPVAILFVLLLKRRTAYGSWQRVISPHLLPHLLQGTQTAKSRLPLIFLLVGWTLAVIGLAGPTWQKLPQAVQKKVNAQVIVMDLSLSMFAQDISPSRIKRAKHKLSDILTKSEEGLTALVVFAGTPHVVTPLTDDTRTILSMIDSLSPDIMPIAGSDPAAAIIKAQEVLKQGGMNQGHIILLTDDMPADFVDKVKKEVNPQNTPVSIFAIGTAEGAPISLPDGNFVKSKNGAIVIAKVNERAMKTAAKQLRGRFTTLTYSDKDVDHLLSFKANLLDHEMKETERDFNTWDEAGHWLALLIIPFAAMGYRKGWLGALLLPALFMGLISTPQTAEAGFWDNLWERPDQQGQKAWRQEQYGDAADKFTNPAWKGSAHYKNNDFERAEAEFSKWDTADGHYNLGNTYAKQQKFDEAISAYQKALELDPDMADAQHNLDTIKQLKEQQEQQQGDGEGESQDSDQSDNKNDQQQSQNQNQNQNQDDQQQDSQSQDQQSSDDQQQSSNQQQEQNKQDSEQQQNQKEKSEEEAEREQQQQAQNKQGEEGDKQQSEPITPQLQDSEGSAEDQQALEQWLQRVPDEPGGLLRRKFKMESKLRNQNDLESQAW